MVIGVLLMIGKFVAWWLTGSVGIFTDAMESIVNVAAGLLSLYALWVASWPEDKAHPFGHGKAELISASAEGIMIFGAGALIIYEGIMRLFDPQMPHKLDIGIMVIAVAGVINYVLGWWSIRAGKKAGSVALVAGGKHLHSDVYSTIGLVAGLVLLNVTKISWIDSALALIFGGIILWTGISILKKTIANLMDESDTDMLERMVEVINQNRAPEWIDVHNTKVVKGGNHLFVDADLTLPWYYNIRQGHQSIEELTSLLSNNFTERLTLNIHSDACDGSHCEGCAVIQCHVREYSFKKLSPLNVDILTQSDLQHHK